MGQPSADFPDAVARALDPIASIRVAWLFGSRSKGTARADSDIDIAVAFAHDLDDRAREDARRDIVDALTDALGRLGERVDVVDLDRCDSAIGFAAIRHGQRLFARSERDRIEAEVSVCKRHADDEPRRQLFRAAAIEAARRMGEARGGRA